jgi:hypothetical protein
MIEFDRDGGFELYIGGLYVLSSCGYYPFFELEYLGLHIYLEELFSVISYKPLGLTIKFLIGFYAGEFNASLTLDLFNKRLFKGDFPHD